MDPGTRVMPHIFPTPLDIGIPGFDAWRAEQIAAIETTLATNKRFMCAVMPVGSGKSLYAMGAAHFYGGRSIALTGTKALMDQYATDFEGAGLVSVKGQNAYQCIGIASGGDLEQYGEAGKDYQSCEEGPCHGGVACALKASGCLYYDAVRDASARELVVSNYTMWMASNKFGKGLGQFGTLILDEAHSVPERLAEFMTTELTQQDFRVIRATFTGPYDSVPAWQTWARGMKRQLDRKLEGWVPMTREDAKEHRKVRAIARKLYVIGDMTEDASEAWIVVPFKEPFKEGWKFCPLWAQRFAERLLFLHTKRVIAMSATMTKKTVSLMGIPEDQYEWHEVPSSFPPARRPVFWIPTVRVDYRIDTFGERALINRVDQIIGPRLDRKGIIHCISYKRRNLVLELSQYRDRMISHDSGNLAAVIAKFKAAPPGTLLVSPSVATGYDFIGPLAEYQIILKVPFPVTTDPVMKARTALDKEYPLYLAMQELQQMTGRIVRSLADQGETFILDDNWAWVQKNRHLAAAWFWEAVRKLEVLPTPPPRLDPEEWAA